MSDLEFQRALSPDQMRVALSLLDGTARAQLQNMQVGDSNPAEEGGCAADQANTSTAMPNRPPAAEGAHPRMNHLNLALAFYGLGIVAAAALTILSWSERTLTPPGLPGIAGEQLPNPQPAQLVSASPALPEVNPTPDQSSHGSEGRRPKPEVASAVPVDQANASDDQAAEGATNTASVAQTTTTSAIATSQARWDERARRKQKEVWWRSSSVRVAAAKRFWRRHWQISVGECFHAGCSPWQKQRAFYEPPRNQNQ